MIGEPTAHNRFFLCAPTVFTLVHQGFRYSKNENLTHRARSAETILILRYLTLYNQLYQVPRTPTFVYVDPCKFLVINPGLPTQSLKARIKVRRVPISRAYY
jgi:hypothetical protein